MCLTDGVDGNYKPWDSDTVGRTTLVGRNTGCASAPDGPTTRVL